MIGTTRHKVFISYYHRNDEYYRNRFEQLFGTLFINKSVQPGEIDTDLSTEYIKRLIQVGHISDSSVVVVLVGAKTYCRKHVDWEISAGLSRKVGGYSGLLGILLPSYVSYGKPSYSPNTIPCRLVDNIESGYARLVDWTEDPYKMWYLIEDAFDARVARADKIRNSRPQYDRNLCE